MPYSNVPPAMQDKMEKCVTKVMAQGKLKENAIAICHASIVGKGKEINYRKLIISDKAITDAPNLRGDDARTCWNCQYFQSLPDTRMQENMADMSAMMGDGNAIMPASGRGICTQFDFETDSEWVCDAWEEIPPQSVAVMKQADGVYRWILFSTSAYQDNDGEIVSQKAQEQDIAAMQKLGDYGTLDWWHWFRLDGKWVKAKELTAETAPRAKPLRLGVCDFAAMHGRVRIESGTFDDPKLGEYLAPRAKELGASISFFHPASEPDREGVYKNIATFSGALLPGAIASNQLTRLYVAKENDTVFDEQIKKLIEKLGGDEKAKQKAEEILAAAAGADNTAQAAGIAAKEVAPPESTAKEMSRTDMKSEMMGMMEKMSDEEMKSAMDKMKGVMSKETKTEFVGDMTPGEFETHLTAAVEKFLTPAIKEIGAQVAKLNDAQVITAKESSDKLAAAIKGAQDMQTDLAARLAALEGLAPRAYSPTKDPKTIVAKEIVDALKPKGDKQADAALATWLAS